MIALGKEFTEPVGAPNVTPFLLVDTYTSPMHKAGKDTIVSSFCMVDSQLCVVICTAAFGLGVNSPDVRQVIHWGPPSDIEEYMQQGHACRTRWKIGLCTVICSTIPFLSRMKDHA